VASSRVSAISYDGGSRTIRVRFHDGVEWSYADCELEIWEQFRARGTSKGRFIAQVLDKHPHGPA
jgi:hypothetical protein